MLNSMLIIYYILNDIIEKKDRYVFPTLPTYDDLPPGLDTTFS